MSDVFPNEVRRYVSLRLSKQSDFNTMQYTIMRPFAAVKFGRSENEARFERVIS